MRAILIALLLIIGTQAGAASGFSGILVCNPNKNDEKPVAYAFDGEYLLRDNQKKTPFKHIASIAGFLEIYFAFEPTKTMYKKLETVERFEQAIDEAKDAAQSKLEGPEGEKYNEQFTTFQRWCTSSSNDGTLSDYAKKYKKFRDDRYLLNKFMYLPGTALPAELSCDNAKGKRITDFILFDEWL
ncbi:hypothetical protein OAL97_05505, partial [Paracoccaceae bacterium]|nr:hypothetical protein [Paracoccaceae bacterium]